MNSPSVMKLKRKFDDELDDLSPSLKRMRMIVEDDSSDSDSDSDLDHADAQETFQSFDLFTRLPGEIRNRIYDVIIAYTLPPSAIHKPDILMTKSTSNADDTSTFHKTYQIELARRQQQPYLSAIHTSALRCVPGLRKEFMSRLWHALTIHFTTLPPRQAPIHAWNFSFLRSVHPGIISYQIDFEHLGLERVNHLRTVDVLLPFIRALEDVEFKGTVRLLGPRDHVELAWCCIDRVQKYWRLGNSLTEVCRNPDGVWRMMSDIYRNTSDRAAKLSPKITFDMPVDMSPTGRIPSISGDTGFIYRSAEPTDPFDGEPWCWQVLVGQTAPTMPTSIYASPRHFSRRLEKLRSIKKGYMKAKRMLAPVPEQEI